MMENQLLVVGMMVKLEHFYLNLENYYMLLMMHIFMVLLLYVQQVIATGIYNEYLNNLNRIISGGSEGEVRVWKIGK